MDTPVSTAHENYTDVTKGSRTLHPSPPGAYSLHMDTNPTAVAEAVRRDIDRISTVHKVAAGTGIAYTTLNRRLATGNFTAVELITIAQFLRSDPADYLRGFANTHAA